MNIFETIVKENENYAGTAIVDGGRKTTYPELLDSVLDFAEELRSCGISEFARVGLLADDSLEYISISLAILAINAAIIPLSTRASESELKKMPEMVELNDLVISEKYREDGDIELKLPEIYHTKFFLRKIRSKIEPVILPAGDIPAFIRFSSGTTGMNKGVVLSHRAVIERTSACEALNVGRGDNVLWVLDMAFHFVVTILLFLRKGAVTVISPRPLEKCMAQCIREFPPSLLYATPYHYRLMIHSEDFRKEDLASVRRAFSTAMKLEVQDAVAFTKKFGIPLTQAYGIIEIGLPCVNCTADAEKTASVGRIQRAYTVKIENPDAEGNGSILIRGPGMFDAYLSPFRLRKDFCAEGWFATGDVGHIDKDGFLFIVGRTKNMINFAGMKIFPYEVESILNSNPLVKDCRVFGKPFPGVGEIPVAEVVPSEDAPADWSNLLRSFCFSNMASYKVPKEFISVQKIERTASGKIIRK